MTLCKSLAMGKLAFFGNIFVAIRALNSYACTMAYNHVLVIPVVSMTFPCHLVGGRPFQGRPGITFLVGRHHAYDRSHHQAW